MIYGIERFLIAFANYRMLMHKIQRSETNPLFLKKHKKDTLCHKSHRFNQKTSELEAAGYKSTCGEFTNPMKVRH